MATTVAGGGLAAVLRSAHHHALVASVPSSAVVAAQPYRTLGGYGLSLQLAPTAAGVGSIGLQALHALPATHPLVPAAYQHLAFQALAEYCTSPRTTDGNVPLPNFWTRIGDVSTTYATLHGAAVPHPAHPLTAGVELQRSTKGRRLRTGHRTLADVKLTLYGDQQAPLFTALMTGMEADTLSATGAEVPDPLATATAQRGHCERSDAAEECAGFIKAAPVQAVTGEEPSAPTTSPLYHVLHHTAVLRSGPALSHMEPLPVEGAQVCQIMGSPAATSPSETSDGACYSVLVAIPPLRAAVPAEAADGDADAAPAPLPPWVVLPLLAEVVESLAIRDVAVRVAYDRWSQQQQSQDGTVGGGTSGGPRLRLVSHNSAFGEDVITGAPCEVLVAAKPRFFSQYHIPPWRHRVGLPDLRGQPCLVVTAQLLQHGAVKTSGVYFFTF